jgi:hypothetical protein
MTNYALVCEYAVVVDVNFLVRIRFLFEKKIRKCIRLLFSIIIILDLKSQKRALTFEYIREYHM